MCPIVLMHGIFGYDRLKLGPITKSYFGRIEHAIAERLHPVFTPAVPPCGPVSERAQRARDSILTWLKEQGLTGQRILVIGHSMGGLDARYMISRLGMNEHVSALLTIATPHHGSPNADFWMGIPAMQSFFVPLLGKLGFDARGGNDLMVDCCRRFNDEVPDSPHVRYFSISASCPAERVPLPLRLGYWVIHKREGDNDALVSVQSAMWGEHLGTWPVHHLHTINRRFPIDAASPVGDIAPMYLGVLDELARRGMTRLNEV